MADLQEWFTACFISFIFAYMVAKLISVVVSFRNENLRVERERARDVSLSAPLVRQPTETVREQHNPAPAEHQGILDTSEDFVTLSQELPEVKDVSDMISQKDPKDEGIQAEAVDEQRFKEHQKDENLLSDDEDWEGIEGTELDETFGSAAAFVEKMALDPSFKISSDLQLRFYGLYKQATEGPCSAPQPPAYKLTARAKWHAWKKLGDISPEEGMQRYITLLSELYPGWIETTEDHTLAEGGQVQSRGSNNKTATMGPVFSVPAEEDPSEEDGLENVHKCAKEGDVKGIEELLECDCPVDQMDSDGRTPLHWAVDQGHIAVVRLLISRGAQINAKDSEGQTALHYAIICQRDEIAEFLLENGADPSITDNDGSTPYGQPPISLEQSTEQHRDGKGDDG